MDNVVGPAPQGQTVQIAMDQTLRVELPENPTTGYRWNIDSVDSDLLEVVSSDYVPPQSSAPGAGGLRVIIVQPKKTGTARLELNLYRSWQGHSSSIEHSDYTVQID